ncbi:Txe/YoeB family addiction module toxin [Spirochaetia bacterium]|nr:Txe/YoeB family addiction module toxin [Spirochaetia bacterium]
MNIKFTLKGWADHTYWQKQDKKTLDKVNKLIQDIVRNGNDGLGKPEALRGDLSGWWSRRISEEDRLVYRLVGNNIEISQCRGHYRDK